MPLLDSASIGRSPTSKTVPPLHYSNPISIPRICPCAVFSRCTAACRMRPFRLQCQSTANRRDLSFVDFFVMSIGISPLQEPRHSIPNPSPPPPLPGGRWGRRGGAAGGDGDPTAVQRGAQQARRCRLPRGQAVCRRSSPPTSHSLSDPESKFS